MVFLASCGESDLPLSSTSIGGVPVDERAYASSDLSELHEVRSLSVENNTGVLVTGDLRGTALSEIAVQEGKAVRILDHQGEELDSFVLPTADLSLALAADLDQDGKDDLVGGGVGGAAAYLAAYNGSGQLIHDVAVDAMIFGTTTPVAAIGTSLYFTAVSDLHVAPKIVGALDLSSLEPAWAYHLGPLPTGLSISKDGGIAISNRALDRERSVVDTPYATDYRRHHTILLDPTGVPVSEIPFGPEASNGFINDGGFSGVRSETVEIEGNTVVVQLLERVSDLYPGPALLRVVTPTGEVIAEHQGPAETDGSIAVYRKGAEIRIAVYWNKVGLFEIYTESLDPLRQLTIARAPARGSLLQVGNFDGDQEIEHLIADRGRISIVSDSGRIEYETEVPTRIRDARIIPGERNDPRLIVLSDRLRFFSVPPSDRRDDDSNAANGSDAGGSGALPATGTLRVLTTPPGAALRIDGEPTSDLRAPRLYDLSAGEHTVEASIPGYRSQRESVTIVPGQVATVDLRLTAGDQAMADDDTDLRLVGDRDPVRPLVEPAVAARSYSELSRSALASIPEGFGIGAIGEFAGDDDPDLLLFHRDGRRYLVLSDDLEPILQGRFPVAAGNSFAVYGDLNGDGRAEIGARDSTGATSLFAMSTDGRIVLDKSFCYGFDTNVFFSSRTESQLLATITTGYLLSPRGAYGLRVGDWQTEFYYPTAGMVNSVIQRNDVYYMDLFTASNGAEIVRSDGYVEKDSEIYIHALGVDGSPHLIAQPFAEEAPHGSIRPFFFATESDAEPVPHYILSKDQYYPGWSGILRGDGTVHRVFTAGADRGVVASHLLKGATNYLSVVWSGENHHQIIDAGYKVVYEHTYGDRSDYITSVNLDGDKGWEIIERREGSVVVLDLQRRVLAELKLPSEPVRGVRIGDLFSDGRFELIIHGNSEIAVYSY